MGERLPSDDAVELPAALAELPSVPTCGSREALFQPIEIVEDRASGLRRGPLSAIAEAAIPIDQPGLFEINEPADSRGAQPHAIVFRGGEPGIEGTCFFEDRSEHE